MTAASNGNEMLLLDEIRNLARALQEGEIENARRRARLNAAIRKAEGVSHADIARAAGVSRQRVTKLRETKAAASV